MTPDRRRFLQFTAAGMVASLTSSGCVSDATEDARALTRPGLIDMLGPGRVRQIGKSYLAAVPSENSADALRAVISNTERKRIRFPWTGRSWIDDQVRDDFAAGRTVLVDGWVLSATEARQCALFSLASPEIA
jgi:hypothetical protein